MSEEKKESGLDILRKPFSPNQIGKLPKPTKQQMEAVKNDFKQGVRCIECGGWHHPKVVHLDYVGHAALTDRFLDADPNWNWEPMAMTEQGLPLVENGLLWIKLTICGVTRIGVGDAQGKQGGDAMKEMIGDGLRNCGMRFGAALDLWHKGDLHADNGGDKEEKQTKPYYSSEEFDKNLPAWNTAISSKKKTPLQFIAFIESKGKFFTDEQKNILKGGGNENR